MKETTTESPGGVVSTDHPLGFWEVAAAYPDRVALVIDGTGAETTYSELAYAANRIANGLLDCGLTAGSRVAVVLSNRMEYAAIQLAVHQVGMALVPVNRHLTPPELAYILGDCGASLIFADEQTNPAVAAAAEAAGLSCDILVSVDAQPNFRALGEMLGASVPPQDRTAGALLFYSSGTTGKPKGIRRPFTGLSPEDDQRRMAMSATTLGMVPGGVFLSVGPLYHAAPNQNMIMGLQLGKTVVLSSGFDADHVLDLIEKHRVTDTFLVPTMMHRLINLPVERRNAADVSSLNCILHAGAICPVETKRAMIDWVGPVLMEYYGASESGATTTISSQEWLEHPGSVGRARPGMSVRVCDESGRQLSPGEIGLVHLGTGLRIEYLGDPVKSESSYVDGHFVPGDLGYLDEDGWLYLCDRRTDMIISGGVNIYPAEVEAALLSHEQVVDAAVFGTPDDEWGQKVVALVELEPREDAKPVAVDAILHHVRSRLAKFKIPRDVRIVDRIPRNPAGKINKARLRDAFESGTLA